MCVYVCVYATGRDCMGVEVAAPLVPTSSSLAQMHTRVYMYTQSLTRHLAAYRNGDGGGGPLPDMLERVRLMRNTHGLPRHRYTHPDAFFAGLEAEAGPRLLTVCTEGRVAPQRERVSERVGETVGDIGTPMSHVLAEQTSPIFTATSLSLSHANTLYLSIYFVWR
jgi:hypothetical protein